MTTNINADDGVVSGVAGLKTSADNSGVLALQTNGITALTVNASQNVGIGTSSPLQKLEVAGRMLLNTTFPQVILNRTGTTAQSDIKFQTASTNQWSIGQAISVVGSNLEFYDYAAGITRLNLNTTGALALSGGTSSADGTGITFPATQSASSNANTLDDYEEGTWTPSIGGTATYSARWGTYTKIGNLVTIMFNISISSIGTGSTGVISGLPFTINNPTYANDQSGVLSYFNGIATSVVFIALRGSVGGTTLFFSGLTAASTGINNSLTVFQNGATIQAGITYQTST